MIKYTGKNNALHGRYRDTFEKLFLDENTLSLAVLFDDLNIEQNYNLWEQLSGFFQVALRNALAFQQRTLRNFSGLSAETFLGVKVNTCYRSNYISYQLPVSFIWVRVSETELFILGKDLFTNQLAFGVYNISTQDIILGTDFTKMEEILGPGKVVLFDLFFPRIPQ